MQEARVELGLELYGQEQKTIAALRLARGYSQHQLAAAVGSTQPHIAKIEAGFTNIYLATAKNISQALGIGLDDFYTILHSETPHRVSNEG
jgi:transcriptional regulator with XRE-family HTH domain